MKNTLKLLCLSFALLFTSLFTLPLYAESKSDSPGYTTHTFKFRDFTYTEAIDNTLTIKYESDISKESYYLINQNGITQDVISVEYSQPTSRAVNPNAHTAFFTRDKNILGNGQNVVTVRITVCVLYYSSGSFRSFEAVQYCNLTIPTSITSMSLSNSSSSAWSHTGSFPCTQLDYAFTTTVTTNGSVSAGINAALISAGFSNSTYSYRVVNGNGFISLY